MLKMKYWSQFTVTIHLFLLALTAFTTSSAVASTAIHQDKQLSTPKQTFFQNERDYQIAQVSSNCRQVAVKNGLYVRQAPTVYSKALGVIPQGRNVTVVENRGANVVVGNPGAEWMPISAPIQGYVFAGFLTPCQASPSPTNCREVSARGGLNVRRSPSINSAVVGVVPNERNVTIENKGANGWVSISAPLQGYVSETYLEYCS